MLNGNSSAKYIYYIYVFFPIHSLVLSLLLPLPLPLALSFVGPSSPLPLLFLFKNPFLSFDLRITKARALLNKFQQISWLYLQLLLCLILSQCDFIIRFRMKFTANILLMSFEVTSSACNPCGFINTIYYYYYYFFLTYNWECLEKYKAIQTFSHPSVEKKIKTERIWKQSTDLKPTFTDALVIATVMAQKNPYCYSV